MANSTFERRNGGYTRRLVPVLFSATSLLAVARLTRRVTSPQAGLFAATCFALTPAQLYYGKMPNHEPPALCALLVAACCFWEWKVRGKRNMFVFGVLALAFGCLCAWPAYLFAAALLVGMARERETGRAKLVAITAAAAVPALLILVQMRSVRADAYQDLLGALIARSGIETVSLGDWLVRIWDHCVKLLSPVGLALLALVPLAYLPRRQAVVPPGLTRYILFPLAVAALGNLFLFREGSFTHEYYCFYLSGLLALGAGLLFHHVLGSVNRPIRLSLAGLVLATMALHALGAWRSLNSQQSLFFASSLPEPTRFVVDLGATIAQEFPEDAAVLANAVDHGPQLGYYARRQIRTPSSGSFATEESFPFDERTGGIIYTGYPSEGLYWQNLLLKRNRPELKSFDLKAVTVHRHAFGLVVPKK